MQGHNCCDTNEFVIAVLACKTKPAFLPKVKMHAKTVKYSFVSQVHYTIPCKNCKEGFEIYFEGINFDLSAVLSLKMKSANSQSEICTSLQANSVGKETSIIVCRRIKFDIHPSMVVFKF